jgi:hypothetical protein
MANGENASQTRKMSVAAPPATRTKLNQNLRMRTGRFLLLDVIAVPSRQ